MKKIFAVSPQTPLASVGLLLVRLVFGYAFILHGWGKIQHPWGWMGAESPVPGIFQALAALSEFGGGIAMILGVVTRLAALGLTFTMLVAVGVHAVMMGDPFVATQQGGGSYELAAIYFALSILFLSVGPGCFSLDRKFFGQK